MRLVNQVYMRLDALFALCVLAFFATSLRGGCCLVRYYIALRCGLWLHFAALPYRLRRIFRTLRPCIPWNLLQWRCFCSFLLHVLGAMSYNAFCRSKLRFCIGYTHRFLCFWLSLCARPAYLPQFALIWAILCFFCLALFSNLAREKAFRVRREPCALPYPTCLLERAIENKFDDKSENSTQHMVGKGASQRIISAYFVFISSIITPRTQYIA